MAPNKGSKPPEHHSTMLEIILDYLTDTKPFQLFVHLLFIVAVCFTLSASYIVAFHWSTVVQIYSEAHDVKGFGQNLKLSVENDHKIYQILENLHESNGSMRAFVYRYHNGLAAINGVPFFFQTNTHEVIGPGATRLMPYEQRMPASVNPVINLQFVKNECAVVTDTDSDKNSQYYWIFQTRSAKAFIRCPIYMDHGDLFGFVGLDFTHNPTDIKKATEMLKDAADQIGDIFDKIKK